MDKSKEKIIVVGVKYNLMLRNIDMKLFINYFLPWDTLLVVQNLNLRRGMVWVG